MEMTCHDAQPLVGVYLDGELSEARASLLRKHLLDCHACRNGAQDGRNLKRWFAATREEEQARVASPFGSVPSGFAARVARRAFAGDVGREDVGDYTLVVKRKDAGLLPFVLTATAIAAGLALLLALGARLQGRAVGSSMSADDRAPMPLKQVVEDLERLNSAAEAASAPTATDGRR